jgi:hypothetical protein
MGVLELGVDAGAIAVLDLLAVRLDRAQHGGEVEVQVDPGEQVEALGGGDVRHHGASGADPQLDVGQGHGHELRLVGGGAAGDGPTQGLLAEQRRGLAREHSVYERLVFGVSHNGEVAAIGLDQRGARVGRP